MRTLGIDHGDARIGLAISDEDGLIARPLQILTHIARLADAQTVAKIVAEKEARLIVVGLPVDSDGKTGPQARKVMRWAESLGLVTTVRIEFWDESNSSVEADELLRESKRGREQSNDAFAAAIMLQSYLDAHRAEQA